MSHISALIYFLPTVLTNFQNTKNKLRNSKGSRNSCCQKSTDNSHSIDLDFQAVPSSCYVSLCIMALGTMK